MSTPTQVRRPWQTTLRTVFQALVAFALILPLIVEASGLDPTSVPGLLAALAVAAAVTRIMAVPQVETFLARFLPFLAADPAARDEGGWAVFPIYGDRIDRAALNKRIPSPFAEDRPEGWVPRAEDFRE